MRLKDAAEIKPGYPFRGPVKEMPDGQAAVVQIKNVDVDGGIDWAAIVRTELPGRRDPDWLRRGDILFTARGNRNVAACVDEVPTDAVCSPHFFIIRMKGAQRALPGFVAWLINQADAQRYFKQAATGSYITSIRRQVLEDMPLTLPNLEKQELIVRLEKASQCEKKLMQSLLANTEQQMHLLAKDLSS